MIRKVSAQIFAAMLFSVAAVNSYAINAAPYLGMQLGVNAGGDWPLTNSLGVKTQFSSTGENLGVFGGYSALFREQFYLAGEGVVNISAVRTGNKTIDLAGTAVKMRSPYSYGISMIPGIKITSDTMLYGRIGLVRTQFALIQTPVFPPVSSKVVNTATGGQFGLGMALSLSKNLDLRGEYLYSQYQSFTAYHNRVSPYSYQLFASFIYKFV